MPSPPPSAPSRSPRELLFGTRAGRVFLIAAAVKLAAVLIERAAGDRPLIAFLGALASVVLVVAAGMFIIRGMLAARRQLLWPVRRKLIVSYVFIGFVPALLLVVFFLFGGQIVFNSVASYLFKNGYERYLLNAEQIAQAAANDVARDPDRAPEVLFSKITNLSRQNPGLSVAILPLRGDAPVRHAQQGPWRHMPPPTLVPAWVTASTEGFTGTIVCRLEDGQHKLIARSVKFPQGPVMGFVAVADIPLGETLADRLREDTQITAVGVTAQPVRPANAAPIEPPACLPTAGGALVGDVVTTMPFRYDRSVAFLDYHDWQTGQKAQASIGLRVRLRQLYGEVSEGQRVRLGNSAVEVDYGELLGVLIVVIAVLFFIIQVAALVMGLALARSITNAVHELFVGTERVRQGDFTHRIQVRARDQLGQLSDSFNQMSTSIEHLLQQAAEKRRLEEELRIAREIQMSLLPSGSLDVPGARITALCVPAREVGGDYYDFFRLGARRFAMLIADVSGKGTSAALYMAELKGLLLSLSTIYQSPRQLLIEVNRIISDHLDTRSFITMTYAVVDLDAGTLVFARAGHTPFLYLPAPSDPGQSRRAHVLAPDGMVLGLRVPNIERLFAHHLTEHTIALRTGDVMALYTDGITEAMNAAGDLFGETRLAHLIEEHADLDVGELRERIVREVEAFAGAEDQHDDLTMILLKIEPADARLRPVHTEGVVEA